MEKIQPVKLIRIVLEDEDFDRAVAEMLPSEFMEAWRQLGKFVRLRAKRIAEVENLPKC